MSFHPTVFGAVGLALAILTAPASAAPQPPEALGRVIAERDCGACHAIASTGASPMAAAPAFRTLGQRYNVEDLGEALAEGISAGHPMLPMVAYPPQEVAQIIAYLKGLQPARPTPGGR